jgi:hypothetical protein
MRYLARAFVKGANQRFAFAPPDEDAHWRHYGITPVHFPLRDGPLQYAAIDDAFAAWSDRAKMGFLDHESRIVSLVQAPPPLEPESVDYARTILKEPATLRVFVENCKLLEWFAWIENDGLLQGLTSAGPSLTKQDVLLGGWIARTFVTSHPNDALNFIQRHADSLNPQFAAMIGFQLARGGDVITSALLKPWIAALMAVSPQPDAHVLSEVLNRCDEESVDAAILLFQFLLRPRLRLKSRSTSLHEDTRIRVNADVELHGDRRALEKAWTTTIQPNMARAYRPLFPAVTAYLGEAFLAYRAAHASGTWDGLSFDRSAIERHGQDRYPDDWEFLVDIARDLLEWMLVNDPPMGEAAISLWEFSESQVLRRLAIHGWGRRLGVSAEDVLNHIEAANWLFAHGLKHEVFAVLERVFPHAPPAAQERFIQHSMNATVVEDDDSVSESADLAGISEYERYNVAAWLTRIAPDSNAAQSHFVALQASHPNFAVRPQPDCDHYFGDVHSVIVQSPVTPAELAAMTFPAAATYLLEYESTNIFAGPTRNGLLNVLQQQAAVDFSWSVELGNELIRRAAWVDDIWYALLTGWKGGQIDAERSMFLVSLLNEHQQIGAAAPDAVGSLLQHILETRDARVDDLGTIEQISERLLAFSGDKQPGIHTNGRIDWLTSAINHPAGQVATVWLRCLSGRIRLAERWTGIPTELRARFNALLDDGGPNGVLGRVLFASHTQFLFSADAAWTSERVLPLFDWTIDAQRAEQAWSGFLVWGQWNDALFERMRAQTIQTFTRMNLLEDDGRALITRLAAMAAYSSADPWHGNAWLFDFVRAASAAGLEQWARDFERYLEAVSRDASAQLWTVWIREYCEARGSGVPRAFEDGERDAMVCWVIPLVQALDDVVETLHHAGALPASLQHFTLYRLGESTLPSSNWGTIGKYLLALLRAAQNLSYACDEAVQLALKALAGGALREDILAVADELTRLECVEEARTLRAASDAE